MVKWDVILSGMGRHPEGARRRLRSSGQAPRPRDRFRAKAVPGFDDTRDNSARANRVEFRRTLTVADRAEHRLVLEFASLACATEQQTATTHVAAADKVDWKAQPL